MSTLLHAVIKKKLQVLEECLLHVEFTYNRLVHSTTQFCLFEVVYDFNTLTSLDLLPLPMSKKVNLDGKKKADFFHSLHKKVRSNIERRTTQYVQLANKRHRKVVFELGEWV